MLLAAIKDAAAGKAGSGVGESTEGEECVCLCRCVLCLRCQRGAQWALEPTGHVCAAFKPKKHICACAVLS